MNWTLNGMAELVLSYVPCAVFLQVLIIWNICVQRKRDLGHLLKIKIVEKISLRLLFNSLPSTVPRPSFFVSRRRWQVAIKTRARSCTLNGYRNWTELNCFAVLKRKWIMMDFIPHSVLPYYWTTKANEWSRVPNPTGLRGQDVGVS